MDDLTINSAASFRGIAFRLPRGGVGIELGPGAVGENILNHSASALDLQHDHRKENRALTSTHPLRLPPNDLAYSASSMPLAAQQPSKAISDA